MVVSLGPDMRIVDQLEVPMLTVSEAATAMRCSPATVRRMISSGELEAVRLGRQQGRSIRVPTSALVEAMSRPVREGDGK